MANLKYTGRVFRVNEFSFIDFDIGTVPKPPALGVLKTGESVTVVLHPDFAKSVTGIWAELVPSNEEGGQR